MIRAESKAFRQKARRTMVVLLWSLATLMFCDSLWFACHRGLAPQSVVNMVFIGLCMSSAFGGVTAGGLVKSFRGALPLMLPVEKSPVQPLFEAAAPAQTQVPSHLDERETRLRDRAHYTAYAVARWLTLALFTLYAALLVFNPVWANRIVPSFFFLLMWTVWTLPQSIILWNEPDMDESEQVPTGRRALTRRDWLKAVPMILFLAGLFALVLYAGYKT